MRILFAILLLAVLAVVGVSARALDEKDYQKEFLGFIKKYHKNYAHDEFFSRYNTFKLNYDLIRNHNLQESTFSMAVNTFADLSAAEFKSRYTGFNNRDSSFLRAKNARKHKLGAGAAPDSQDWTTQGFVTAVKNQQQCGSCWSFSTTGAMEALYMAQTKSLPVISEQQLVDCSTAQGNQGCNGGLMDDAFQYYITTKTSQNICLETEYPYTATGPNACTASQTKCSLANNVIAGFTDVAAGDENALRDAVAAQPVSVAIEADQSAFQFYAGGIMNGTQSDCGTNLDHGVLAVGYGHDATTGLDFWKVKNSWGASWGEQGYIRFTRGVNLCGIANAASYPHA